MDVSVDLYAALGVDRLATTDEIDAAYRALIAARSTSGAAAWTGPPVYVIRNAHTVLSDPQSRRTYDRERAMAQFAATGPRLVTDDECEFCASTPCLTATFRRQVGMLVARRRHRRTVRACRDCGRHIGREMQNATLWLGWWGVISLFTNIGAVASNAHELRRLHRLDPPHPAEDRVQRPLARPMDPGRSVLARSGTMAIVLPVLAVGATVYSVARHPPAVTFATYAVGDCVTMANVQIIAVTSCSSPAPHARIVAFASSNAGCPAATTEYAKWVTSAGVVTVCLVAAASATSP